MADLPKTSTVSYFFIFLLHFSLQFTYALWNSNTDRLVVIAGDSLYVFGGYGPHIDDYLHGIGEFFWDMVSLYF